MHNNPMSLETNIDDLTVAQKLLQSKTPEKNLFSTAAVGKKNHNEIDTESHRPTMLISPWPSGQKNDRREHRSNNTWTESSEEAPRDPSELVDRSDRTIFIDKYNTLAIKHGVRLMSPHTFKSSTDILRSISSRQESWFSRKILRRKSSTQFVKNSSDRYLRHKRSLSEISLRLKSRKDKLKDKNLEELGRLCGASLLYLPTEYAAGSLFLPTCFRALIQYLIQHGTTSRGLFRIPGSHSIVNELFNYYCHWDKHGEIIAGTIRSPTLPDHIQCDVYDVASALKKFLEGLPGGILGSVKLFDAFISIKTQLNGGPELTRTKLSSVRARLIALAVLTLTSQYRRALICAIFGLLCIIGRTAETAKREDDQGRPLPTSDLMGYGPLSIIIGPFLTGDLIEDYNLRLANPRGGLILLPMSPKSRKEQKSRLVRACDESKSAFTQTDKIEIANSITEMLITQWRDVVRHLKNLTSRDASESIQKLNFSSTRDQILRPCASESFSFRKPPEWSELNLINQADNQISLPLIENSTTPENYEILDVKSSKRPLKSKSFSAHKSSSGKSPSLLSKTIEETPNLRVHILPVHVNNQDFNSSNASDYSSQPYGNTDTVRNDCVRDQDVTITLLSSGKKTSSNYLSNPLPKQTTNKANGKKSIMASNLSEDKRNFRNRREREETGISDQKILNCSITKASNEFEITQIPRNLSEINVREFNELNFTPDKSSGVEIDFQNRKLIFERNVPKVSSEEPKLPTDSFKNLGISPQYLRDIVRSEPNFKISSQRHCSKTISRSLYDVSRPESYLSQDSKFLKKDELVRLSQDEDLASLKKLAKVLDSSCSHSVNMEVETERHDHHSNAGRLATRKEERHLNEILFVPSQASDLCPISGKVSRSTSHRSKKFSDLLARFDNHASTYSVSSKTKGINCAQLQNHISIDDQQSHPIPIKDRLLASYTTNSPSPTKSRLSIPSDATSKRIQNTFNKDESPSTASRVSNDRILATYTTNSPSPTKSRLSIRPDATDIRISRAIFTNNNSSVHSETPYTKPLTPLKDLQEIMNDKQSSSKLKKPNTESFSFNNSNLKTIPLRNVKSCAEKLNIKSSKSLDEIPRCLSLACQIDGNFSNESCISQFRSDLSTANNFHKNLTTNLISRNAPTRNTYPCLTKELKKTSQQADLSQGCTNQCSMKEELADQIDDKPASLQALYGPVSLSPVLSSTPGRFNPLLYDQVRNLQRQLHKKTEEVQKLRQQLDTRQDVTIGLLNKQLQDSKRLIQSWRERSELFEQKFYFVNHLLWENSSENFHDERLFSYSDGTSLTNSISEVPKIESARSLFEIGEKRYESDHSNGTVIRKL